MCKYNIKVSPWPGLICVILLLYVIDASSCFRILILNHESHSFGRHFLDTELNDFFVVNLTNSNSLILKSSI